MKLQKSVFLLMLCLFILACKKDKEVTPSNVLSGKIRTLEFRDNYWHWYANYKFYYDETSGQLKEVTNKDTAYLRFNIEGNKVNILYTDYILSNFQYELWKANINSQNYIESIDHSYDTTGITMDEEYTFKYNTELLDSINGGHPMYVSYSFIPVKNYDYIFDGNNYTSFKSSYGYKLWPWDFESIIYESTTIMYMQQINDGQVPLQYQIENNLWFIAYAEDYPSEANLLFMLGLLGYHPGKTNKNLIKSSTFANYFYEFDSNGRVKKLTVTNLPQGYVSYVFNMTYY